MDLQEWKRFFEDVNHRQPSQDEVKAAIEAGVVSPMVHASEPSFGSAGLQSAPSQSAARERLGQGGQHNQQPVMVSLALRLLGRPILRTRPNWVRASIRLSLSLLAIQLQPCQPLPLRKRPSGLGGFWGLLLVFLF